MKKISIKTLIIYLLIIFPIFIVWIGVTINQLKVQSDYSIKSLISENSIYDQGKGELVEKYISENIENLKVVRDSDEITDYLNNQNSENYQELTGLFLRLINNKSYYEEIKLVDPTGQEIAKVNNTTVNQDLSNIANKDYITSANKLEQNQIYISEILLDENLTRDSQAVHGTMTFSTPIYKQNLELQAILVIKYEASYYLDLLLDHNEHNNAVESTFLVLDKNGNYIVHDDLDIDSPSFSNDNQDIWLQMKENSFEGSYTSGNQVISYYDVLKQAKQSHQNYNQSWILVHQMQISDLLSLKNILATILNIPTLLIIAILNIFAMIIAYSINGISNMNSELEISMSIAESTNDAVMITDDKTRITYVNSAFQKVSGYSFEEIIGSKPSRFSSGKTSKVVYTEMWNSLASKGQWEGILWDKKKNGLIYPKKLRIVAIKDKNNKVHHYIGVFKDLHNYTGDQESFDKVGYRDGQLSIPNEEVMIELLNQSTKLDKPEFMAIYVSIDNYNQLVSILEKYKLDVDMEFSRIIQPLLNKNDFFAQTGRNLFTLVIDNRDIKDDRHAYIKKMHNAIEKNYVIDDKDIFFKIRMGISKWPDDTDNVKKLLLNAMVALEWTNYDKTNQIAFFNQEMITKLNDENQIESLLKSAIKKDELSVVYQPQIDLKTEKVTGMEALVRWNCEKLGFISPAIFIPIAENNNLMNKIGYWIIKEVFSDLKKINRELADSKTTLRCAINLSVIQMKEVNFEENFLKLIEAYQIDPNQIEVEITESIVLENRDKTTSILNALRTKGISVAIDDFGTGYSSLSYLQKLPIDKIKIDRSFIKGYPNEDDGILAKILVDMSKSLKMKVLAEGAEDSLQVEYLKSINCDYIQGYYYSKPLKLEEFINYVKDKNIE